MNTLERHDRKAVTWSLVCILLRNNLEVVMYDCVEGIVLESGHIIEANLTAVMAHIRATQSDRIALQGSV